MMLVVLLAAVAYSASFTACVTQSNGVVMQLEMSEKVTGACISSKTGKEITFESLKQDNTDTTITLTKGDCPSWGGDICYSDEVTEMFSIEALPVNCCASVGVKHVLSSKSCEEQTSSPGKKMHSVKIPKCGEGKDGTQPCTAEQKASYNSLQSLMIADVFNLADYNKDANCGPNKTYCGCIAYQAKIGLGYVGEFKFGKYNCMGAQLTGGADKNMFEECKKCVGKPEAIGLTESRCKNSAAAIGAFALGLFALLF